MRKDVVRILGLISQIGISMLAPILLCTWVGAYLGHKFGGGGIILIIMILLGVAAGFRSVYMLTREFYRDKDKDIVKDLTKATNKDKKRKEDE